jgi:AcrR family transcriptional regulator
VVISAPSLRERKKAATRDALIAAALRLAVRDGVESVTVDAIAEVVDVSPRTFFNYFSTKEEAILPSDQDRRDQLVRDLASRPIDEEPLVALHAVTRGLAERLVEHADEAALRSQLVRDNPSLLPRQLANYATFERSLIEGVAARTGLDPDLDLYPALAAATAMGALRAATQLWRSSGDGATLAELVDAAFSSLAAGLATAPAQHVGEPKERADSGKPA